MNICENCGCGVEITTDYNPDGLCAQCDEIVKIENDKRIEARRRATSTDTRQVHEFLARICAEDKAKHEQRELRYGPAARWMGTDSETLRAWLMIWAMAAIMASIITLADAFDRWLLW